MTKEEFYKRSKQLPSSFWKSALADVAMLALQAPHDMGMFSEKDFEVLAGVTREGHAKHSERLATVGLTVEDVVEDALRAYRELEQHPERQANMIASLVDAADSPVLDTPARVKLSNLPLELKLKILTAQLSAMEGIRAEGHEKYSPADQEAAIRHWRKAVEPFAADLATVDLTVDELISDMKAQLSLYLESKKQNPAMN